MIAITKEKKSLFLGIGVICLALIITAILAITRPNTKPSPPKAPAPTEVSVIYAEPQEYAPVVTTTAKVTAKRDIDLTVQVPGIIQKTESNFSRGAKVKQGDLLITVDDQNYLTTVARAESELARAEEALAIEKGAARQAKREWRDLKNNEANDLFLRRPQIAAAEANLRSAQFNLQQAQTDLDRTRVKAPFSGQISDIRANLGQYVTVGTPLARLVSNGYLEIAAPLTINEINRLGLGRNQRTDEILQRDVEVLYSYGFDENSSVTGKLVRFDLVADDETQVRHAIIEIKDDSTPISPGELVSVNIPGDTHPEAIWLPEQALYQRSEVMTVIDEKLTPFEIKVLEARNGNVLVAGVQQNMPIVVERPFWSGPGTIVSMLPATSTSNPVAIQQEQQNPPLETETGK